MSIAERRLRKRTPQFADQAWASREPDVLVGEIIESADEWNETRSWSFGEFGQFQLQVNEQGNGVAATGRHQPVRVGASFGQHTRRRANNASRIGQQRRNSHVSKRHWRANANHHDASEQRCTATRKHRMVSPLSCDERSGWVDAPASDRGKCREAWNEEIVAATSFHKSWNSRTKVWGLS